VNEFRAASAASMVSRRAGRTFHIWDLACGGVDSPRSDSSECVGGLDHETAS